MNILQITLLFKVHKKMSNRSLLINFYKNRFKNNKIKKYKVKKAIMNN